MLALGYILEVKLTGLLLILLDLESEGKERMKGDSWARIWVDAITIYGDGEKRVEWEGGLIMTFILNMFSLIELLDTKYQVIS